MIWLNKSTTRNLSYLLLYEAWSTTNYHWRVSIISIIEFQFIKIVVRNQDFRRMRFVRTREGTTIELHSPMSIKGLVYHFLRMFNAWKQQWMDLKFTTPFYYPIISNDSYNKILNLIFEHLSNCYPKYLLQCKFYKLDLKLFRKSSPCNTCKDFKLVCNKVSQKVSKKKVNF